MFSFRFFSLAAAMAVALSGSLKAEVLFHEDFESGVYPVDLPIPVGFGVIAHGAWNPVPSQCRPGVVVQEGENHVLELKAASGFERGSRAIALLGRTNDAETVTEEALRFRLRFKMTAALSEGLYIQLGGTDGKSKAVLTMDDTGMLFASFGGERQPLGSVLESNHWYTVEILLPAQPRTKSVYTVRLFDGSVQIGQGEGRMARSMEPDGANYRYIDIQHNRLGETLLIDDIHVETVQSGESQQ